MHQAGAEKGVQAHVEQDISAEDEKESDAMPDGTPIRCKGTTKSGRQCRRRAAPGSEYCSIHKPEVSESDNRAQDLAEILKELSSN